MTSPHVTSANPPAMPGPGALLAQARTDLRWSREDVAAKLHLSPAQIQAMEADDFANLPGSTYVRGYLKSYAQLLGISPETVLEAHARLTAKPAQQDFSTIAPQREITSRHHQVRFTTYLVGAIVVGLAVAWWAGREARVPAPPITPTPSASTLSPTPQEGTDATPVAEQSPAPGGAATETSASPTTNPATSAVTPPPATVPATRPTATATATSPAAMPAPTPSPVKPLPATGPRGRLVMIADEDTWADIRDARQVKLLYETVPAGRTVTLEGIAPFSVFLGNASGARLEYNGKAVDVRPYQRGMIARFVLGEDSAGTPTP